MDSIALGSLERCSHCSSGSYARQTSARRIVPELAKRVLRVGLLALASAIAGCGGGSSDEAAQPTRAGSADIDASGGSVDAVIDGGITVTLTVPPGAVTKKTTFLLQPVTSPGDASSAMQMSPAGTRFRKPVTLKMSLPDSSEASNKLVTFAAGSARAPLGAFDATTRTMSVELSYLGVATPLAVSAGGRTRAASARSAGVALDPAMAVFVENGDLASALALWHRFVAVLADDTSRDNGIVVQLGFGALLTLSPDTAAHSIQDQIVADMKVWRDSECQQLAFGTNSLATDSFIPHYEAYQDQAVDVIDLGRLMHDLYALAGREGFFTPAACATLQDDIAAPVRSTLPRYTEAARSTQLILSTEDDFDALLNTHVNRLQAFIVALHSESLDDLVDPVGAVARELMVRLRAGAYQQCQTSHIQLQQRALLVRTIADPDVVSLALYGSADMIADVEYCGMPIHWKVLDAHGIVLQSGDAGGVGPGTAVKAAQVILSSAATLVLSGPLSALRCASGLNDEQLSFMAGPETGTGSSVSLLARAGDGTYLGSSDLRLQVTQLLALSRPGVATGNGTLQVMRTGATCAGDFPQLTTNSAPLVNFALDFGSVAITTNSLPNTVVGTTYGFTVQATGGTTPRTWSATGLPGGLSIDTSTGTINGSATSAGTSNVVVTVRSADGSMAQHSFILQVSPATGLSGAWDFDIAILNGTVGTDLKARFLLVQSGGDLRGSVDATNPIDNFLGSFFGGTFSASVGADADGHPTLENVTVRLFFDFSRTGHDNCQDREIHFPGSVAVHPGLVGLPGTEAELFVITPIEGACDFTYAGFRMTVPRPF
jgi:hypothetical protein